MLHPIQSRRLWSPGPLSRREWLALLDGAAAVRQAALRNAAWQALRGRRVALLCAPGAASAAAAFSGALAEAGASVTRLHSEAWRSSAGDKLPEAARLLGRLYDAIDCNDLPQRMVAQIERHAGVPVFNGLAQPDHPLHLLAEFQIGRAHV